MWKTIINIISKIIIGGGFIALLFAMTIRTSAQVVFENGEYKLNTNWYISLYSQKSKQIKITGEASPQFHSLLMRELNNHPDWEIQEIIYGNFTNEGKIQAAVYVWKIGSYDKALPFWVKENDDSYKQHLFLYEFEDKTTNNNQLKTVWQSSNLPYINIQTKLEDINNDGENELIVIERPYLWGRGYYGKNIAVWKWDEWGFKNLWRSNDRRFE